ncbi:nuclear transport factor 2 family protein [Achromobacter sp.]|uniref:nuclear transport factor 2 family protein n=1 Tax=Achromobacter sp. TaxID=134375 RepID=UPI002F94D5F9
MKLSERVARLEDREAIFALIAAYARAADQRNSPALMQDLFHADAVWEANGFGRITGRSAILTHLAAIGQEQIVWSLHYMVAPELAISPDRGAAACSWYLWELAQIAPSGERRGKDDAGAGIAHWIGGLYRGRLARRRNRWRFTQVELDVRLLHANGERWQPGGSVPQ